MKQFVRLLLGLVIVSGVACTSKGEPYQKHEPEVKTQPKMPDIVARPEVITPSSEAQSWEPKFKASKDPLHEVLLPLADRVLDSRLILDKATLASRSAQDELIVFNHLLMQTTADQRATPEFKQLLQRYENALNLQCGPILDSCYGLKYFRMSGNSAQVAKLLAINDPEHYYRMLLFAVDLKNINWDPDLIRMLNIPPPVKSVSNDELQAKAAFKNMLATALQSVASRGDSAQSNRQFLEQVHGWSMVGDGLNALDGSTQDSVYTMMANSNYLYGADGSLHPDLQKLIAKIEAQPTGFFAEQKQLHDQNIFNDASIGAKTVTHFDELYFIIDSVFQGKMSPASGAALFGSSKKSVTDLKGAIVNYLRIEFLLAVTRTSILAQQVFTANVVGPDLFQHFIEQSDSLTTVWSAFNSHALPLQAFAQKAARTHENDGRGEAEINNVFDSIQKSINLVSAFPHTLILFHLISQEHFQLYFHGAVWNSDDIITNMFNGHAQPFVNYSQNKDPFNEFDVVYAVDMALRTGLFRITKVDPDFFISDTLRRMSTVDLTQIDKLLDERRTRFQTSPHFIQLKAACDALNGHPAMRHFYFDEVSASPYYGMAFPEAFRNVTVADGTQGGIFYADEAYAEGVEQARLGLGERIRLGHAMLESYKILLHRQGLTDDEINQKTQLSQKMIANMESHRQQILDTGKTWFNELGTCYFRTVLKDHEVQLHIIDYERAYLRQVHRDITKLRSNPTDAEKATIEARVHFTGLPSNFQGLDRISKDGYIYNLIDLKLRIAKYMMQGLTTDEGTLPPIAPDVVLEYGKKLDADLEIVKYSPHQSLPFLDSENEFVLTGLRTMLAGDGDVHHYFINWLRGSYSNFWEQWEDYLKSMIALSRLEHQLDGKNEVFTPSLILSKHEEILNITKLSAADRALMSDLHLMELTPIEGVNNHLVQADVALTTIKDTYDLFDMPLKMVNMEQLGQFWKYSLDPINNAKPVRESRVEAGRSYYKSRATENRGVTIFPYNKDLDATLDKEVIGFEKGEANYTLAFHHDTYKYLAEAKLRPVDDQPRSDLNIYMTIRDPLTDSIIPGYVTNLNSFNISTGNCFASDTLCRDFQP